MFEPNVKRVLSLIQPGDVVLDLGGWAQPFRRANYVIDVAPYETRGFYGKIGMPPFQGEGPERFSKQTWIQRDICDHAPFPFADKSVDFVICSHTLEDIRDPLWVCSEIIRIGKRGYIEVPSRLQESIVDFRTGLVGNEHHHWLVAIQGNRIEFERKGPDLARSGLHLPAWHAFSLKKEERVQFLFWENQFEYTEISAAAGERDRDDRQRRFVLSQPRPGAFRLPLAYLKYSILSLRHKLGDRGGRAA